MPTTCVIADDQSIVREGFSALLSAQPDMEIVGQAENGAEAVILCRTLRPDVVLMDVRMPVMDGLAATREILGDGAGNSTTRVIVLTTFDLDDYVYAALRAGASGFLLKDASVQELLQAIRVVAAGEALLAPSVTRRLIANFARQGLVERTEHVSLTVLTPREKEVLQLVARGLSNAEISVTLFVAEQTTKTHVSRILSKLGLRDRTQAVIYAYESGLIAPGDGAQ